MKCREATSFLSDYLSGELPSETLSEFEGHLSRCPNCRTFLQQFRTTLRAGAHALGSDIRDAEAEANTVMPDELVRGILQAVNKRKT